MSDTKKTKKELIDELEILRGQLRDKASDDPANPDAPDETGVTRRSVLKAIWAAPVILSIPLTASPAVGQPSGTVQPGCPTMDPTLSPTMPGPTAPPATLDPTRSPTLPPTTVEATLDPTRSPTMPPPTNPPPTTDPTRSPTLPPPTDPVQSPSLAPAAASTAFPTVSQQAFPAAAPAPRVETALFSFDD